MKEPTGKDARSSSDCPSDHPAPDQKGEDVSQHHRLAQGKDPRMTGKKTPP